MSIKRKLVKLKNLREAVIAVTYKCNARCWMCSIWKKRDYSREIDLKDFDNLPGGLTDVNITGGEPFLRKDLSNIIEIIGKRCPRANITISSNGFATELILVQMKKVLALDKDIVRRVGVVFSVDGIGRVHDKIRGIENGFEKVIKSFKGLRRLGLGNLKLGFTLADYNFQELRRVYELAVKLGVELSVTLVHSSENYFGAENDIKKQEELVGEVDWLMNQELKSRNYRRWGRAFYAFGMREFILTGKRILPDYSGKLSVFIDAKGEVYPCDVSSFKMGKLKDFDGLSFIDDEVESGCGKSWMVCTVRQSIKRHYFKVGFWIFKNKLSKLCQDFQNLFSKRHSGFSGYPEGGHPSGDESPR